MTRHSSRYEFSQRLSWFFGGGLWTLEENSTYLEFHVSPPFNLFLPPWSDPPRTCQNLPNQKKKKPSTSRYISPDTVECMPAWFPQILKQPVLLPKATVIPSWSGKTRVTSLGARGDTMSV
jgi:hypothetical protein